MDVKEVESTSSSQARMSPENPPQSTPGQAVVPVIVPAITRTSLQPEETNSPSSCYRDKQAPEVAR